MGEESNQKKAALTSAQTFMMYAHHSTPFEWARDKIHHFMYGKFKKKHDLNDCNTYWETYEDSKIKILAHTLDSKTGSPHHWIIYVIYVVKTRWFLSPQYETVFEEGQYPRKELFREGLWINYIKELEQRAKSPYEKKMQQNKLDRLERMTKEKFEEEQRNKPIDDSSIFRNF